MTKLSIAEKVRSIAAQGPRLCLMLVFMAEAGLVSSILLSAIPARAAGDVSGAYSQYNGQTGYTPSSTSSYDSSNFSTGSSSSSSSSSSDSSSSSGSDFSFSGMFTSTSSSSSSNTSTSVNYDGLPPCPDSDLATGLRQAHYSWQTTQEYAAMDAGKTVLDAQNKSTATGYRSLDKYCIKGISKFFDLIRNLLSGIDGIIQIIKSLIQSILDQVCSAVATSINSLLSSICLPLPSLDLSFSLPSFSGTSCDGLSLASIVQVSAGSPLNVDDYAPPSNYFSNILSRDLTDKTLFKW